MNYGLKNRDLEYILEALGKIIGIEEAIIFGSRAIGNYKSGSDVDIAIKGQKVTHSIVSTLSYKMNEEYPLPYFFDIVHYEKIKEQKLIDHIDQVGKTIYKAKK